MPIRRPLAIALAGLALGMPVSPALAQDASDPNRLTRAAEARAAAPVRLLDVAFTGGTLAEFVDAVRAAADPEPVNVVLLADAGALAIPSVTLRRVTAESAFRAVCSRSMARVDLLDSGGDPIITVETDPGWHARQAAEQRATSGRGAGRDADSASLRVYSVREFVDGASVTYATVLDALKTALNADGPGAAAEVMHHEASGVLIVRGSNQQQNVAAQVLEAIREDARVAEDAANRASREQALLRQQLADMETQVRRAELQLSAAAEKFEHTQKLAEGSFVSEQEVLDARHAFELAQLGKEQMEVQRQALEEQLNALGAKAGPGASRRPIEVERTVTLDQIDRPELIAMLFAACNDFARASRGHASIRVIEVNRAANANQGGLKVTFEGDEQSTEAQKQFVLLCDLVRKLNQPGD